MSFKPATPRYRLSTTEKLSPGGSITLTGNAAHYLSNVLRLKPGEVIALFSREAGEYVAQIVHLSKREALLQLGAHTRAADAGTGLTVCFAPIKGGRLETILEKATELGADVLQPVFTTRSVVDKLNAERAESIAREAAEQCERVSWPEIRKPVKLLSLLSEWPAGVPLIYGDESGQGVPITQAFAARARPKDWAILAGPEGGFTPDEFAALKRVSSAIGVGLGPRILRADTAIITLASASLMAWGDWDQLPRFTQQELA